MKEKRKDDEFDTPYTSDAADIMNKPLGGMAACSEKGCTAKIRKGGFYRKTKTGLREVSYMEYHMEKEHGKNPEEE